MIPSKIPDSAFANGAMLTQAGFVRVPDMNTLFSHPKAPGLLFRRVQNVAQAKLFGGVAFVSGLAGGIIDGASNYPYVIQLYGDPVHDRWSQVNISSSVIPGFSLDELKPLAHELNDPLFNLTADFVGSGEVKGISKSDSDGYEALAALAIVTPCHVRGRIHATTTHKYSVRLTNTGAYSVSFWERGTDTSIANDQVYAEAPKSVILQWRVIPAAGSCRERALQLKEEILERWPSKLRAEAAKSFDRVIAATDDDVGPLVLQHLTVDGAQSVGWGATNYSPTTKPVWARVFDNNSKYTSYPKIGATNKWRFNVEHFGCLNARAATAGVTTLHPISHIDLDLSIPVADLKSTLLFGGASLDSKKIVQDFTPLATLSFEEGVSNLSDFTQSARGRSDASSAEGSITSQSVGALRLVSPVSGPDLMTWIVNLCVRIDGDLTGDPVSPAVSGPFFPLVDGLDRLVAAKPPPFATQAVTGGDAAVFVEGASGPEANGPGSVRVRLFCRGTTDVTAPMDGNVITKRVEVAKGDRVSLRVSELSDGVSTYFRHDVTIGQQTFTAFSPVLKAQRSEKTVAAATGRITVGTTVYGAGGGQAAVVIDS